MPNMNLCILTPCDASLGLQKASALWFLFKFPNFIFLLFCDSPAMTLWFEDHRIPDFKGSIQADAWALGFHSWCFTHDKGMWCWLHRQAEAGVLHPLLWDSVWVCLLCRNPWCHTSAQKVQVFLKTKKTHMNAWNQYLWMHETTKTYVY